MLNWPSTVDIWFDAEEQRVGIAPGTTHVVGLDEDAYFIYAKEDLQYFGLEFPLEAEQKYECKTDVTQLPLGGIQTVYYFDLDEPL